MRDPPIRWITVGTCIIREPYFGAADWASFWKRGSFRSGSNMGSSRSSVGVSGESFALLFRRLQGDDFLEARVAAKHSRLTGCGHATFGGCKHLFEPRIITDAIEIRINL